MTYDTNKTRNIRRGNKKGVGIKRIRCSGCPFCIISFIVNVFFGGPAGSGGLYISLPQSSLDRGGLERLARCQTEIWWDLYICYNVCVLEGVEGLGDEEG